MRSKKKFSQKPKWNQNKKEQFISKADIKKANELIRKLQSPYVKDKTPFKAMANKLYSKLSTQPENKRIFFRSLKEKKLFVKFGRLTDISNNIFQSF